MDCKNPCKEYRTFKKRSDQFFVQASKDKTTQSDILYKKEKNKIDRYCIMECPHPEERAKSLLQKL